MFLIKIGPFLKKRGSGMLRAGTCPYRRENDVSEMLLRQQKLCQERARIRVTEHVPHPAHPACSGFFETLKLARDLPKQISRKTGKRF